MKFSEKQQRRLFNKLKHWRRDQAYGYLTSQERLYLISLGCRVERPYEVEYAQQYVAKGFAAPQWFYFFPTKEVLSKIPSRSTP